MSLALKLLVLAVVALAEAAAVLLVARRIPAERRGPIVPVLALSSVVVVALVAYFLFYFGG